MTTNNDKRRRTMINHYLLDYMAAATIMTTATEKPTLYVDMELYFAVTVPVLVSYIYVSARQF